MTTVYKLVALLPGEGDKPRRVSAVIRGNLMTEYRPNHKTVGWGGTRLLAYRTQKQAMDARPHAVHGLEMGENILGAEVWECSAQDVHACSTLSTGWRAENVKERFRIFWAAWGPGRRGKRGLKFDFFPTNPNRVVSCASITLRKKVWP
jgi:hypothetical protein